MSRASATKLSQPVASSRKEILAPASGQPVVTVSRRHVQTLKMGSMVIRLSHKLSKKIDETPTKIAPLDENPLADWSGHLFTAARTQYLILTNPASLYSAVIYGRGVTDGSRFIERGLEAVRDVMVDDSLGFLCLRLVAPSAASVVFSKSLNRSVMGSMSDLINCAKVWLTEEELSPYDVSFKLNEMPMSAIRYANPREALKSLSAGTPEST